MRATQINATVGGPPVRQGERRPGPRRVALRWTDAGNGERTATPAASADPRPVARIVQRNGDHVLLVRGWPQSAETHIGRYPTAALAESAAERAVAALRGLR